MGLPRSNLKSEEAFSGSEDSLGKTELPISQHLVEISLP